MCSSEGQIMGMTSYRIICLDFATNLFSNIGNLSILCIDKELLMMGSLSLIKELPISIKIQLFSKKQLGMVRTSRIGPIVPLWSALCRNFYRGPLPAVIYYILYYHFLRTKHPQPSPGTSVPILKHVVLRCKV